MSLRAPCPFCGSAATPANDSRSVPMGGGYYRTVPAFRHWIECSDLVGCGARGPRRATIEEAAEAWERWPLEVELQLAARSAGASIP